jgi:hypothetical protein
MKKTLFILGFVLLTSVAASAQQVFMAALTGNQENPPNASAARGSCKIVLNAAETQYTVSCTYSGLSSPLTAAHTHTGAVGVNGPVIHNYAPPTGSTSGSFNAGPFAVTPAQVADMRAHRLYSNLHSTNLPGGEIRGQIKQAHTVMDADGDGRTDATVFRQSTNQFWIRSSLNPSQFGVYQHGTGAGDIFLNNTADFDGDGLGDPLLLKLDGSSNATWSILQSSTNTVRNVQLGIFTVAVGDTLAISDYDGDGIQDPAVYRRSTGQWWIIQSTAPTFMLVQNWGAVNDFPSVGDYDGDGKADLTAVRVESGQRVWYIRLSTTGAMRRVIFGASATDGVFFFAPFDMDGDGKQDIAVNRIVSGQRQFHWLESSTGAYRVFSWGASTSTALFGDFDGDGKTDLVARRNNGVGNFEWEIARSSDGGISYITWGVPTDQIAPTANDGEDFPNTSEWEMSSDQKLLDDVVGK